MNRDEIDAEPSEPGARELIESTSAAHLAHVAADGTPRVVPVGFFWTGEEFVIVRPGDGHGRPRNGSDCRKAGTSSLR